LTEYKKFTITSFSWIGCALKFFRTAVASASLPIRTLALAGDLRPTPVDSTVLLKPPLELGTESL
jgi:hypothetical protein